MNKMKVPSSYVKRSTRLGKKSTLPESHPRPRPLEVLFDCEHDKRLLMANAHLLKGTTYFVKPKLKWADRQKEKSLLKLRYDLIQEGFEKKYFRIRDLKLFYNGSEIDDACSFDIIRSQLQSVNVTDSSN